MQKGQEDRHYSFQGLQKTDEVVELIGMKYGEIDHQKVEKEMKFFFDPMKDKLQGGVGQFFDYL